MNLSHFMQNPGWELFGLAGQCIFGTRFLYQWYASERAGRSYVPVGFWWLSILGAGMSFAYAFHKGSLAFMIPVLTGMPVYVRNLMLIRRENEALRGADPDETSTSATAPPANGSSSE